MPDSKKYVSNFIVKEEQVWVEDVEAKDACIQNASDISSLAERVGSAEGDITSLDGRLDDVEGDITYINSSLTTVDNNLSQMQRIMKRKVKKTGTFIVAHAGNAGDAPENSKVGILRACHYSYDAIEFDTQITYDNVPVVAHNDSLATFSTGSGLISNQNYSAIYDSVITVDPYNARYSDAEKTLPTVADALNIIRRFYDIVPIIDIKDSYTTLAKMNALLDVCDTCGVRYETIFLCDSQAKATLLLQADPNVSVMLVVDEITNADITYCVTNGLIGIDCNFGGMTRTSADNARKAGLIVGGWTVNASNISSMATFRSYIPDMYTVWSPAFFANGASYSQDSADYGNFWNTYKTAGGLTGITKFDWDRICSGSFTWHASAGNDPYPANSNYALLNRAMLCKKIPAKQNDVISLKGSPTFQYNVVEYSKTAKLTTSGWVQTDYTVQNASTVFVIIEARRSNDTNISIIDLDTFTNGVYVQ